MIRARDPPVEPLAESSFDSRERSDVRVRGTRDASTWMTMGKTAQGAFLEGVPDNLPQGPTIGKAAPSTSLGKVPEKHRTFTRNYSSNFDHGECPFNDCVVVE